MIDLVFPEKVSRDNIPAELKALLKNVVSVYQKSHGKELAAIYVHGSAARGDWQNGMSDLDTVGFTSTRSQDAAYELRKQLIARLETSQNLVPYIEAYVIDQSELHDQNRTTTLFSLLACGVLVWGDPINFEEYLPSINDVYELFIANDERLVKEYGSGKPLRVVQDTDQTAARRYLKRAIRALELLASKQDKQLYTSVERQVKHSMKLLPAQSELIDKIKDELVTQRADIELSVDLLDRALQIYRRQTD